ncbi:hypothetical protein LT493_30410 [Streptomyces tricolor]|nr:hypothetical protein [Streptomyces tricolor]
MQRRTRHRWGPAAVLTAAFVLADRRAGRRGRPARRGSGGRPGVRILVRGGRPGAGLAEHRRHRTGRRPARLRVSTAATAPASRATSPTMSPRSGPAPRTPAPARSRRTSWTASPAPSG